MESGVKVPKTTDLQNVAGTENKTDGCNDDPGAEWGIPRQFVSTIDNLP